MIYRSGHLIGAVVGVVTAAFASSPSTGQSVAPRPASAPSSITVPIEVYRGWILVHAEIDGHVGTFVLDTGSPVIALNGEYVQRSTAGTLDTVTTPDEPGTMHWDYPFTVHTITIGTMRYAIDSADKGPPVPFPANTMIAYNDNFNASGNRPILGLLGLPALEPFEVIIDYPHKQLTLIRLDSAGTRHTNVTRFAIAGTAPLVPMADHWWGVHATLGDSLTHDFALDTGTPCNTLLERTRTQLGTHLTDAGLTPIPNKLPDAINHLKDEQSWRVDRVTLGARTITATASRFIDTIDPRFDILGSTFFQQLTVVGFNFRTHTFITYR